MSTFVCLDTNIYIRFISQGMPGCEQIYWDILVSHVKNESIVLIVPEVVSLEFEKQWQLVPKEIKAKFLAGRQHLEKSLPSTVDSSEMRDLTPALLAEYNRLEEEKMTAMEDRFRQMRELLAYPQVHQVPLTSEILLLAKKRSISGKLADPSRPSEADCMLVESLLFFFSLGVRQDAQLLFCSENKKDFGLTADGNTIIHPSISQGLPASRLFLELKSLTDFIKNNKPVVTPTPEEINEAVEHENESDILRRAFELEDGFSRAVRIAEEEQRMFDRVQKMSEPLKYLRDIERRMEEEQRMRDEDRKMTESGEKSSGEAEERNEPRDNDPSSNGGGGG